ncbi:hypothetical protein FRB91_011147 [Serendipita sp. 411]|nr:hypothetical protein FRC18_010224 [Serendipita sp. 400]KAG8848132.1 hypothetical protein FRB91_011147 [Serendipita sp. 411]
MQFGHQGPWNIPRNRTWAPPQGQSLIGASSHYDQHSASIFDANLEMFLDDISADMVSSSMNTSAPSSLEILAPSLIPVDVRKLKEMEKELQPLWTSSLLLNCQPQLMIATTNSSNRGHQFQLPLLPLS